MNAAHDDLIGRSVLGRYRIVHRLARGGMGVVYLARTEGAAGFAKPAVVKRILPDLTGDDTMARMFVREAQILSYLQHPAIVGVLDFGEEDGAYIMVLEYVHGFHLGRWSRYLHLTEGRFPYELAVYIVSRVLDGLHYAHKLTRPDGKSIQVVHRDISPSNILLDTEGRVKLVDFGIARVVGETQVYKTEELTVKGKFPYLAPELFTGQQATVASDVYACGAVLHELLAGKQEFRGRDVAETIHRVMTHQPTQLSSKRDDVPPDIDAVIHRAMAKNLRERYSSAAEFLQALRDLDAFQEEKMASELHRRVQHDFLGATMAGRLNVEPLQVLDAAWRKESQEFQVVRRPSGVQPMASVPRASRATPQPSELSVTQGPEAGKTPRWLLYTLLALAVLAGVAGVAVTVLFGNKEAGEKPKVLVLEPQRLPEKGPGANAKEPATTRETPSPGPQGTEPADPVAAKNAGSTAAPTANPGTARHPGSGRSPKPGPSGGGRRPLSAAAQLTQAVRQQQPQFNRCFTQFPEQTRAQPTATLHYKLAQSGSVTQLRVAPASLSTTDLGLCLRSAANKTRFPPQPSDSTAFSIQVRARGI
ncbi:MAG: serine/threonine protein kinase [Polyangiales bacterium]